MSPTSRFLKFLILKLLILSGHSQFAQSTIIQYLSGTDKDHTVEWDFMCSKGRNSNVWSKIAVPSCWELQGFGSYHYGWEEDFKDNESGLYRHSFKRDPAWKNKTVRIVFEGSMTDTEVRINGKSAGPIHQGSFYRFKYDITKLLKDDNLLEVKVSKISSDTSVNRAERMSDFWVFGGIFRPVYLEILPSTFIDWVAIDAKADGSFTAEVYPNQINGITHVEAQIQTPAGKPVGDPFIQKISSKQEKIILSSHVKNPALWNPESPQLYKVNFNVYNGNKVIHIRTEKFGFRTVEFKEKDGFYVNDTRVVFKGVNRHSFWPTSGRTTSKEISILDVNLIKDMNMNAVRMSHYPPDVDFLDVCDSLGLFVLDELAGWQKKYDTPVGKKLVKEMIIRDVNHPSIVIWDNGNEGGNNHELVGEYHKYDPQKRKVIHPWNIFQGTDTQHYKGYDCCPGTLYNGTDVFFPTEIIHGLYDGGHGAGLNDHWKLMKNNPLSAGCFLWCFADEGIVRHDQNDSIDVKGNRAPDGIVGPYREKEGSFYSIKEIWSPVEFLSKNFLKPFDGLLPMENNFLYTDLKDVSFSYRYVKFPSPYDSLSGKVISKGTIQGPAIAPGVKGILKLPVPEQFNEADVLYVKATDPHKREIFEWSWPLKTTRDMLPSLPSGDNERAVASDEGGEILLSAHGIQVTINKSTGLIEKVKNTHGMISLSGGPALAQGEMKVKGVRQYSENDGQIVEIICEGDMKHLRYTMLGNGVLKISYSYSLYGWNKKNEHDFLGVTFNYPEHKVKGVEYLGVGPYRVWKNRMRGGTLDVWKKAYNNTVTGESWDYPEFKGYHRDFKWVRIENSESPFLVFTDTDKLFLRLLTPEKPKGAGNDFTSPAFPSGDLSFLHGINPIGTKFDGPENHGPEGAKNKIGPEWISGNLYFDFRDNVK